MAGASLFNAISKTLNFAKFAPIPNKKSIRKWVKEI
jgi:hypothetical protein